MFDGSLPCLPRKTVIQEIADSVFGDPGQSRALVAQGGDDFDAFA